MWNGHGTLRIVLSTILARTEEVMEMSLGSCKEMHISSYVPDSVLYVHYFI